MYTVSPDLGRQLLSGDFLMWSPATAFLGLQACPGGIHSQVPPYHLPPLLTKTQGLALTFTYFLPEVCNIETDGHFFASANVIQIFAPLNVTLSVEVCGQLAVLV